MTHVKICGITNLHDALAAAEAGADLLGFVFFSRSPRCIDPERAGEIVAALKQRGNAPHFVGVFVDESLEHVRAIAATAQLDMAQLHGNESPEMVSELRQLFSAGGRPLINQRATEQLRMNPASPVHGAQFYSAAVPCEAWASSPRAPAFAESLQFCGVLKALRPRDEAEAQSFVSEYRIAVNGNVPSFIVDAFDAQRFGGTGARADRDIAARVALEFPILLAGGLNADNVSEAIRAVRPWGVDVSSGVERAPGLKDHDQVRQFVRKAKSLD
jgi:phosphoribosylanthranilate isomerase